LSGGSRAIYIITREKLGFSASWRRCKVSPAEKKKTRKREPQSVTIRKLGGKIVFSIWWEGRDSKRGRGTGIFMRLNAARKGLRKGEGVPELQQIAALKPIFVGKDWGRVPYILKKERKLGKKKAVQYLLFPSGREGKKWLRTHLFSNSAPHGMEQVSFPRGVGLSLIKKQAGKFHLNQRFPSCR